MIFFNLSALCLIAGPVDSVDSPGHSYDSFLASLLAVVRTEVIGRNRAWQEVYHFTSKPELKSCINHLRW